MKRIITIVGARPQFVKAATLSREFVRAGIDEKIVHTGQHFDANMSEVFFTEMEIPQPAYHLDINGVGHGAMTGRMLEGIEKILLAEKPEGVLVFGDTNSTLAGALAAAKLHIPVIHVEAGLRSFNMQMPEEINRILTDRISSLLFCPTDAALKNLAAEGFANLPVQIVKNGDVMQDAALYYARKASEKATVLNHLPVKRFVLATVHRQENTDDPVHLKGIVEGLNAIHREVPVVLPLHPRTRNILQQSGLTIDFITIDPVGYFDMISLLQNCQLVVTDSGGVQKEAFFFQKQCITLREQTEWVELVEHGFNRLTGSNPNLIQESFFQMMNQQSDFSVNLYGNGEAARKAVSEILKF
ncbi:MAG: UDP-N-acetylglucosamine 2-epimerase (non-hydrolyzing) [Paludibacter sp.]|jgi:UDP-GlcNAc3NAcA epimerase|nr:UDP-N-acetylglucosamine 2-epimerase (non-hydrolyzing) [Paludibacter sp.]